MCLRSTLSSFSCLVTLTWPCARKKKLWPGVFSVITGYSREEALGQRPHLLNSGQHDASFFTEMFRQILANGYWTGEIINRCKRMALVDGIRYQRLGDDAVWAQELFETEELTGYLTNMLRDTKRSIYEHVVYDSATERDFADALEKDDDVVLYAKLPGWFKVPTPLGNYNPDWAVLVNKDGTKRLYFVVETKSSLFTDDLRNKESAKIECGKAHFKALAVGENPAKYVVAMTFSDVLNAADI